MSTVSTDVQTLLFENNFRAFKQQHHITTTPILNDEELKQYLQDMFQNIENFIAVKNERASAPITAYPTRITLERLIDISDDTQQQNNRNMNAGYDFQTHTCHIPYSDSMTGLYLLGAIVHESEHANQSYGKHYTQDQRQAIWICRECLQESSDGPFYWNQYTEMRARIVEAQYYLDAYKLLTKRPDILYNFRNEYINEFGSMRRLLNAFTSKQNIKEYLETIKQRIKDAQEFMPLLAHGFPKCKTLKQQKHAAIKFLKQTAPRLYQDALTEIEQLHKQLGEVCAQIEQDCSKYEAQLSQQAIQNNVQILLTKYHLPLIDTIPKPAPNLLPVTAVMDVDALMQQPQQPYNLAVYLKSPEAAKLVFDSYPYERPYSAHKNESREIDELPKTDNDEFVPDIEIDEDNER